MKQNMHILIMLHNFTQKLHINTLEHINYPYYIIAPGLAFVCCPLVRCCDNDRVKCPYTGPIGWLTNTYTSQNTLHKKGFNVNILQA